MIPQHAQNHMADNHMSETGARPISVKGRQNDKMRRESLAQSLGTGMSWGGVSVNSWIRDEYVFHCRACLHIFHANLLAA
jgi:hypothetical protein